MTEITWTDEKRKLNELVPWEKNPRQINKDQARRLRQSLSEFGQVLPICIDPSNTIIDGHQRNSVWSMADEYGPKYTVDVRVASRELSDKEQQKLTIFLEKAKGDWNFDTMANFFEVDDLLTWGFDEAELDLELWGLPEPAEDPGAEISRADELREKWQTETGQLWQLGEHRLICGDCTDAAVVERLMGGERAGAVVTDPPYNVAYSSRGKNKDSWGDIENDDMTDDEFYAWLLSVGKSMNSALDSGGVVYLCHRDTDRKSVPFIDIFKELDWTRSSTIIWAKQNASMGWQDYRSQHECLSYGWKNGAEHYFSDDRSQTTLWTIDRDAQATYKHPTQKPVALFEKAIENSTRRDDLVIDFFLGSGTTLVACERLNRKCRAVEISPAYVAVALERWAVMTGNEPKLIE